MGEPRLEDISDYETLRDEKKRVVIAVVLAGLIMGVIYTVVSNVYDGPKDSIQVEKTLKHIPMK